MYGKAQRRGFPYAEIAASDSTARGVRVDFADLCSECPVGLKLRHQVVSLCIPSGRKRRTPLPMYGEGQQGIVQIAGLKKLLCSNKRIDIAVNLEQSF